MAREKNPVALMDSVDALDLLEYCYRVLRDHNHNPKRLAEIKKQRDAHKWALRKHIDGTFEREDALETPKRLAWRQTKRLTQTVTVLTLRPGGKK